MDPLKVQIMKHQSFASFPESLKHSWKNAKPALKKKTLLRMRALFDCLCLLEYQVKHEGRSPESVDDASELLQIGQEILPVKGIDASILEESHLQLLASTASTDFSPSCAVLGGVLAQDILNALGGKEAPLVNFFVFDGETNAGDIYALSVTRT